MPEKVQVYIYDLSRGMARSLGPAIIGEEDLLADQIMLNNSLRYLAHGGCGVGAGVYPWHCSVTDFFYSLL